jgi:CheY-like chemotaxis protein
LKLWDGQEQPWQDPLLMHQVVNEIHQLVGSSKTLGFARLGAAATTLEREIQGFLSAKQSLEREQRMLAAIDAFREAANGLEYEPTMWLGPPSDAPRQQLLQGMRLLFVEDSGDLVALQRTAMQLAGAKDVQFCLSAPRARAYLTTCTNLPHVALIDFHLGRQSGSALASWMQSQSHLTKVLRVSYSATTEALIRREIEDSVYQGFITKPIDLPSLVQRIATLYQQARQS